MSGISFLNENVSVITQMQKSIMAQPFNKQAIDGTWGTVVKIKVDGTVYKLRTDNVVDATMVDVTEELTQVPPASYNTRFDEYKGALQAVNVVHSNLYPASANDVRDRLLQAMNWNMLVFEQALFYGPAGFYGKAHQVQDEIYTSGDVLADKIIATMRVVYSANGNKKIAIGIPETFEDDLKKKPTNGDSALTRIMAMESYNSHTFLSVDKTGQTFKNSIFFVNVLANTIRHAGEPDFEPPYPEHGNKGRTGKTITPVVMGNNMTSPQDDKAIVWLNITKGASGTQSAGSQSIKKPSYEALLAERSEALKIATGKAEARPKASAPASAPANRGNGRNNQNTSASNAGANANARADDGSNTNSGDGAGSNTEG